MRGARGHHAAAPRDPAPPALRKVSLPAAASCVGAGVGAAVTWCCPARCVPGALFAAIDAVPHCRWLIVSWVWWAGTSHACADGQSMALSSPPWLACRCRGCRQPAAQAHLSCAHLAHQMFLSHDNAAISPRAHCLFRPSSLPTPPCRAAFCYTGGGLPSNDYLHGLLWAQRMPLLNSVWIGSPNCNAWRPPTPSLCL